jgi:hypothetical protein
MLSSPSPLKKPRIMALDSDSPVAKIADNSLPIPPNQFELPPLNFNSTSVNFERVPSFGEILSQAHVHNHFSPYQQPHIQPQSAQIRVTPIHSLTGHAHQRPLIQQDSFNKAKIIQSSSEAYSALLCLASRDPRNRREAWTIINQVKQITDYGEAILNQYLTQNEFDKAYNFLFILSFFNKDFTKIFRINNDKHMVSAENTIKVMHYIVENLHDKLLPLLNVFASDNLSTMLYLYDTDKAKTTLGNLCELIKKDPFQELKTIFPGKTAGSFLSKTSNFIKDPDKILKDILDNIENVKLINRAGFNSTQISRIFSPSRYNFGIQVKSFVKHINLIKDLIGGEDDDKKNFFSAFLNKITKNFDTIIPLFCKIDFFEVFKSQDIRSKINQSKIFDKLRDMKGQFKITDELLKSFEILIAPKTSYLSSTKEKDLKPDSHLKDSGSGFASFEPAPPLAFSPASASISAQPIAHIADPISASTFTFYESSASKSSREEAVKDSQPILKALITNDKRPNPNLSASVRNNDSSLEEAPSSNPIPSGILASPASKNPNAVGDGGVAL